MFVRTHHLILIFLKHYGMSETNYQEKIGLKKMFLFGHPSGLSMKFESNSGVLLILILSSINNYGELKIK